MDDLAVIDYSRCLKRCLGTRQRDDKTFDEEEITWRPRHGYVIRPWLVALPVTFI